MLPSVDIFREFTGEVPSKNPLCYIGYTDQLRRGGIMIYAKEMQPAWAATYTADCSINLGNDTLKSQEMWFQMISP